MDREMAERRYLEMMRPFHEFHEQALAEMYKLQAALEAARKHVVNTDEIRVRMSDYYGDKFGLGAKEGT